MTTHNQRLTNRAAPSERTRCRGALARVRTGARIILMLLGATACDEGFAGISSVQAGPEVQKIKLIDALELSADDKDVVVKMKADTKVVVPQLLGATR